MADISKIDNGTEYNLKDATARAGIASSKTLKSSVVTVTDAAPINAEDIKVDITPVQDLHGYNSPWAGGAWKNKLPMTVEGIKVLNTDGTWSGNTYTRRGVTVVMLVDSGNNITGFRLSGTASENMSFYLVRKAGLDTLPSGSYIMNGCPAGGAGDGSTYYMGFYAPGKSKYDMGSGTAISLSGNEDGSANIFIRISSGYAIQGSLLYYPMIRLATETDASFAPYSNICPIEGRTGAELTQKDAATDPTVTRIYSTNFGETVYGGKWHVTEGGTDKTYGYVEFDGSDDEQIVIVDGGNRASLMCNGAKQPISPSAISGLLSNEFKTVSNIDTYYGRQGISQDGGRIFVSDGTGSMNLVDFKAFLSNNPLQVVYELATPTTISTPKQNVPMLQGINTVSADCGDTQLKYQPDNVIGELKGEIESATDYVKPRFKSYYSQPHDPDQQATTTFSATIRLCRDRGYVSIVNVALTFWQNYPIADFYYEVQNPVDTEFIPEIDVEKLFLHINGQSFLNVMLTSTGILKLRMYSPVRIVDNFSEVFWLQTSDETGCREAKY